MSHVNAALDISHSFLASIDRVIFMFLPLNSFLNMLADLTYVFLSSSFLKVYESMCNWHCRVFDPCVFNRLSFLCYRFLQKLFDL